MAYIRIRILDTHDYIQRADGELIFADKKDGQLELYGTDMGGTGPHFRNTRVEFCSSGDVSTYAKALKRDGDNHVPFVRTNCYKTDGWGKSWRLAYRNGVPDWLPEKIEGAARHLVCFLQDNVVCYFPSDEMKSEDRQE
jgi:hypothetical protein